MEDNVKQVLYEVVKRYDCDGDGRLSYTELYCFLMGFWGSRHGTSLCRLNRELFTEYRAEDVVLSNSPYTFITHGYLPLDEVIKWSARQLEREPEIYNQRLCEGLRHHGYCYDETSCTWRLMDNCVLNTKLTWHNVVTRAALMTKQDSHKTPYLLDVLNCMRTVRCRPNEQAMKVVSEVLLEEEELWDNLEEMWYEEDTCKQMQLWKKVDKSRNHLTKRPSEGFARAMREIFDKFDVNGFGILNELEFKLFHLASTSQLCDYGNPQMKYDEWVDYWLSLGEREIKQRLLRLGYTAELLPPADITHKATVHTLLRDAYTNAQCQSFKGTAGILDTTAGLFFLSLQYGVKLNDDELAKMAEILNIAVEELLQMDHIQCTEDAWRMLRWALRFIDTNLQASESANRIDSMLLRWLNASSDNTQKLENLMLRKETLNILATTQTFADHLEHSTLRVVGRQPVNIASVFTKLSGETTTMPFLSSVWRSFNQCTLARIHLTLLSQYDIKINTNSILWFLRNACHNTSEISDILNRFREEKIAPPYIFDVLDAQLYSRILPDILPEDVYTWSPTQIREKIAIYLGIQPAQVNNHFVSCGIIAPDEDLGEIIANDARTLLELNVSRKVLSERLHELINWGRIQEAVRWVLEMNSIKKDIQSDKSIKKIVQKYRSVKLPQSISIEEVLHASINATAEKELVRRIGTIIGYCGTSEHHLNPFTPKLDTFCYKHDHVGGSADCIIANISLLPVDTTPNSNTLLLWLSERLNSRTPAPWQSAFYHICFYRSCSDLLHQISGEPGILYIGDMLPYLIRTACLFEGPKSRYRVDPEKACKIVGLIS